MEFNRIWLPLHFDDHGTSRTADIERVLTIGAHGPERLIVIFVDELGEN
jgi:hypothetical protein